MESVLRQSKAMCPFLRQATPARLRALSMATACPHSFSQPLSSVSSSGGGSMSRLTMLAQRCPVMSKAMAITASNTNATVVAGVRRLSSKAVGSRGGMHSTGRAAVLGPFFSAVNARLGREGMRAKLHATPCAKAARPACGPVFDPTAGKGQQ